VNKKCRWELTTKYTKHTKTNKDEEVERRRIRHSFFH
jgi:hypothetical protein